MSRTASSARPAAALLEAAARGELPAWALVEPEREAHTRRVATLMGEWADALELPPRDAVRWRAAGLLHDALRDAPPHELLPLVPPDLHDLEPKVLHGPATARRLRDEGVSDEPLLLAIAWHTLGHGDLDTLGRALYTADALEPGRQHGREHHAALRARMPHALDDVVRSVARERLTRLLEQEAPLRPETVAFWNALAADAAAG